MRDCGEREFTDIVRRGFAAALDFLLPRKCVVCESILGPAEMHICSDCLEDLPRTYYWLRKFNPMADRFNALIQERMGMQITQQEQQSEVTIEQGWQASAIRIDYVFAAALFFYRAESGYRRIPYQIKYHGDIPAGRFFGQMLGEKIASAEHFADVDDFANLRDTLAVNDVEFSLLEWWSHLVLYNLHLCAVTESLVAVLDLSCPADINAD